MSDSSAAWSRTEVCAAVRNSRRGATNSGRTRHWGSPALPYSGRLQPVELMAHLKLFGGGELGHLGRTARMIDQVTDHTEPARVGQRAQ